jgi:hypothetical protein
VRAPGSVRIMRAGSGLLTSAFRSAWLSCLGGGRAAWGSREDEPVATTRDQVLALRGRRLRCVAGARLGACGCSVGMCGARAWYTCSGDASR